MYISVVAAVVAFICIAFVFHWVLVNAAAAFCEPTALNTALVFECPSLAGKRKFRPTPWLFSAHMQTLFVGRKTTKPAIDYVRQMVPQEDGGVIALDWSSFGFERDASGGVKSAPGFEATPVVVILHGLTGGSRDTYVRTFIAEAHTHHGLRCVVMNARGCGGAPLLTAQYFSAAWTEDVRRMAPFIQRAVPSAPLVGIGFSLGSNVLAKYLGEEGARTPFVAGISVGNPWDCVENSRRLNGGLARHTYSRVLASQLARHYRRNAALFAGREGVSPARIARCRTVREFDDAFTRVIFGYESVDAYYRDASSARCLAGVRVPLLAFSDLDDPICPPSAIPYAEARANPNLILVTTRRGGHLGWYEGWSAASSWLNGAACEFVDALLRLRNEEGLKGPERRPAGVSPAAPLIPSASRRSAESCPPAA